MAHLHLYSACTPGLTDGVEVLPDTGILDYSGIYLPITGTRGVVFTLGLRCDSGFKATGVTITPTVSANLPGCGYALFGPISTVSAWDNWTTSSGGSAISIPTLLNVNICFLFAITRNYSAAEVDTSGIAFNISFTEGVV